MPRDATPRRILHVEDRAEDAELVRRIVASLGIPCEVHRCRDGPEAIAFSEGAAHGSLDLVLLDLKIPRVDGQEVLRVLKRRPETAGVPVVVFSSSRERGDVAAAYERGANSYVVKPVTFAELREVVTDLAGYWLRRNLVVE